MAARRLLAVMLVFLAISSVLAVLAPPPIDEQTTQSTTTTARAEPSAPPAGRLLRREIEVRGRGRSLIARPARIEVHVGDQLSLAVIVPRTLTLELGADGPTETAAPGAPARFDLFISRPGPIRLAELGGGRPLAQIDARSRERGRAKASAGGRSRTSTETKRRSRS